MTQIRALLSKQYKLCTLLMGLCAVLALYMTWCLSTISYQGRLYEVLHFGSTLITAALYGGCLAIFEAYWRAEHLRKQLQLLNIGILGAFALILISDIRGGSIWLLLSDAAWLLAAGYGCHILRYKVGGISRVAWLWARQNYALLILLLLAGILGVRPVMLQFRWDGALYEQACRGMNIHSMSSMAAYAHLAQGYGVLFCLINILVPDTGWAMAVTNITMYLASIVAFWGIMRHIVPGRKKLSYLLITAIYACSPYTLGMVNYYSLDFATLCLFVCMLYFWIKREWVLQFVAALLACFTKEPAIISYGALCAGMVAADILRRGSGKVSERIGSIFKRMYYYPMLLTGGLWAVTYMFLGGWNAGDGGVAADTVYIADKLKVLYILNFSWFFIVILIGGSIGLRRRKTSRENVDGRWITPLAVSTVGFTLFSIVFKTVNHARYTAQVPAVLYIMGGYILLTVIGEKTVQVIAGILACLMLVSSYLTIDPVSRRCFQTLDVGSMQMITTGTPVPGDSMIYNKQMLGMEYALSQAVEYAVENDCMVIMPMYDATPNLFDGLMQEMEEQEYGYSAFTYWSEENKKRTIYEGEDTIAFTIYEWRDTAELARLPLTEKDKHCFIYSSQVGEDQACRIREAYADADYKEYHYGGWTVLMLIF
ncbi:MAG: hypothetical protein NC337_12685 [Roseburia sp.]|nr:hypothetical protein [Roseburia sp.]